MGLRPQVLSSGEGAYPLENARFPRRIARSRQYCRIRRVAGQTTSLPRRQIEAVMCAQSCLSRFRLEPAIKVRP